jgi:DHA1 family multidrug resistance protein-like MFS transporter
MGVKRTNDDEDADEVDHSRTWPRNLYVLWLAEFFAVVGFSVTMPILPLYIKVLGVQSEREARIWAGLVVAAHAVTMAILAPVWGVVSDRYGRKLMVERAMFGGATVVMLMGFVQSVQQLALLRAVQGMLTGTVAAATTLLATTAPRDRLGYAMGSLQMAVYIGRSVGPLLGGVVADTFGYRAVFVVTSGLLLTAGLAVLTLAREPARVVEPRDDKGTTDTRNGATLRARVGALLAPVLASAPILGIFGLRLMTRTALRMSTPTLPLFIEMITPPGSRVATISGLTTGISALAGAVGGSQLGRLSDRVGHRSILVACAVVSVVCYLPQSLVEGPVGLIALQAGAGLAMGGILASVSAALARLAPEGREGIVYGVDSSVVSVANGIGPMVGSLMAAYWGLRTPFVAAAAVFALAGVAAFKVLPRSEPRCQVLHASSTASSGLKGTTETEASAADECCIG